MTTNKVVGDIITYNVTPTPADGIPSNVNFDIVCKKKLSTGIIKDLQTFTSVPLNTNKQYPYTTISEDIPNVGCIAYIKYVCPLDNSIKETTTTEIPFNVYSSVLPLAVNLSVNPTTIILGQQTTFIATVTGGISPYSYNWSGFPIPCTSSNTNSITCTPTIIGTFNITVIVTDTNNVSATSSIVTLTINSAPTPTTNLILNSNFSSGVPDKWTKYQSGTKAIFKYPEIPGKDGTGSCISIEYPTLDSGKYARWTQNINIDPIKIYTISGWMKTDNISPPLSSIGGTTIQIDWKNSSGGYINSTIVKSNLSGNTDWTKYEISSIIPSIGSVKVTIILILKNCTGKVLFDNIFVGY